MKIIKALLNFLFVISIVIPNLLPEIEELLVSETKVIIDFVPNSTNSFGATFTVDVTGLSEKDRDELLKKNLINGFYIGKYFEEEKMESERGM